MISHAGGGVVLLALPVFLLGLSLGSFLNVVIHRLPLGISLVRPRSRCPACERPIRKRHNVPLFGWLALRGRCADCRAPIPVRYPLVELGGGVLALVAVFGLPAPGGFGFLAGGPGWIRSLAAFWLFFSLLAVFFIDLEHRIIPDEISLGGTALGLLLSPWTIGLIPAIFGALAGGGSLFLCGWAYQKLRGRPGMGLGDVKLAGMLGTFLGLAGVALTVVLASLLGSVLGIFLILRRRGDLSLALPFGAFLAPAAWVAFLWGPRLWTWYAGFFPAP